jgi:hypothetical protein
VFRVGVWSASEEEESSNYREFTNLVEDTELEAQSGRLSQVLSRAIFIHRQLKCRKCILQRQILLKTSSLLGASTSLYRYMQHQIIIHMVSGKRMIAQGTDGCSRGVLMEGVMAGQDMLTFVDLDKSAFQRHAPLLDWIRSWTMQSDLEPLTPEQWFVEGHGIIGGELDKHKIWKPIHEKGGKFPLWAPTPALADAMLEQLLKAHHKRTDTFHVICIPRLMSPRWRRLFHKVSDLNFVVPAGASFWPSDMVEPLWISIVLPFIPHRPWQLKRAPLMVELARQLCEVCKDSDGLARNISRKLLKLPGRLASVPPSVASGMLHMPWSGDVPHVSSPGRRWSGAGDTGEETRTVE